MAPFSRSSNAFDRWLISITDMPTPGSDEHVALRLLEHGQRQNGGTGGEVEDTGGSRHGLLIRS